MNVEWVTVKLDHERTIRIETNRDLKLGADGHVYLNGVRHDTPVSYRVEVSYRDADVPLIVGRGSV